ncbi:MAG: nuclear transport factor 2 family protein [Flavobacteriales bacterium]|nr:nuclear transport factor 2 family protein [Flavobacteriales bacterium]
MRTLFVPLVMAGLVACTYSTDAALAPPEPVPTRELAQTIAALDSALFAAFNAHDAARLGTWFTPDLEFYHDKTGLAGYDSTMANFRGLFARNADTGLRRELVPGSLEVYPLGEFGLLEVCKHRFCHTENGKQDCGTFRNIMIWRKEGDGYKVCRVISYDH